MSRYVLLSLIALSGCVSSSIMAIPYSAQPQRIANPREEVKSLILANTAGGCVATPEVKEKLLVVQAVCSGGVGNWVIRFDRVKSVALEQSGEWYRVVVKHSEGITDFAWTSKSLEDMQRMADAITALANLPASPQAKDTPSI